MGKSTNARNGRKLESYKRSRNGRKQKQEGRSEIEEKNNKKGGASWALIIKRILTCKSNIQVENPYKLNPKHFDNINVIGIKKSKTMRSSSSSSVLSVCNSTKGKMPFRKLSGCYESRTTAINPPVVVGLIRDPSLRATTSSCPHCGDIFIKPELLELHQATNHAVSELSPEDTSRNIVEMIFQSSWINKEAPVCKIERILKVQNTRRTISNFEEYRDVMKSKAKKPRCIADGNELLRFYSTTFTCSLGLNASSNLCNTTTTTCGVCCIIRHGFKPLGQAGILTTATSIRAHQHHLLQPSTQARRAMLVCRVIAGRVNMDPNNACGDEYDSVAAVGGEELYVHNSKAILPCFVVVYHCF